MCKQKNGLLKIAVIVPGRREFSTLRSKGNDILRQTRMNSDVGYFLNMHKDQDPIYNRKTSKKMELQPGLKFSIS